MTTTILSEQQETYLSALVQPKLSVSTILRSSDTDGHFDCVKVFADSNFLYEKNTILALNFTKDSRFPVDLEKFEKKIRSIENLRSSLGNIVVKVPFNCVDPVTQLKSAELISNLYDRVLIVSGESNGESLFDDYAALKKTSQVIFVTVDEDSHISIERALRLAEKNAFQEPFSYASEERLRFFIYRRRSDQKDIEIIEPYISSLSFLEKYEEVDPLIT